MIRFSKDTVTWVSAMFFLGFYGTLHFVYFQIPDEIFKAIYYNGLGLFCADIINFVAPLEGVAAFQNYLISSRVNLEIVRGCDGAGALFLITAAILSFPVEFERKCIGLVLGVSMLYSINLIRISGLYFVIAYRPEWFNLVHIYLTTTLMIILGCLFFIWWAFGSSNKFYEPT